MNQGCKNILYTIILILSTALYSCKKSLDAGIYSTVTGTVFDPNRQLPIGNAIIYISEYGGGFWGYSYKGIIDSVKSDVNGKFNIRFATTGNGLQYRVGFNAENFYSVQDAIPLSVGKDTVINFTAYKLNVLKATLQIKDNPNPPVNISALRYFEKVWRANNDTVVYIRIIPNLPSEIQFFITNVDTPSIQNYLTVPIDIPGFDDTFNVTIPLDPRSFPKRR